MDAGLCLSKEQSQRRIDRYSDLFKIKEIDSLDEVSVERLLNLYDLFKTEVQGEVLNQEDLTQSFLKDAIREPGFFHGLFLDEKPVGFMKSYLVFNSVLIVRMLYILKPYQGLGLACKLVDSIHPKEILFQTRKENEPVEMLKIAFKHGVKIDENEHTQTWRMIWRQT